MGAQAVAARHPVRCCCVRTEYFWRSSVDSAELMSLRRSLEGAVKCACVTWGCGAVFRPGGERSAADGGWLRVQACLLRSC